MTKTTEEQEIVELHDVEIPARLLHVTGCRAKSATRYALDHVCLNTWNDEDGTLAAVATDGRRLIAARWSPRNPEPEHVRLMIPGEVAGLAARVAGKRAQDMEPMAVLRRGKRGACKLTVFADDGPVVFEWQETDAAFPDFRPIIPRFDNTAGVARLGIYAKPVATTLMTIRKVVGDGQPVLVYLPSEPEKPVGMEVPGEPFDVQITALIMPAKIDEWTAKPAAEATKDIPGQMKIDQEIERRQGEGRSVDDDAWMGRPIADLKLPVGLSEQLVANELGTVGAVAAWAQSRYTVPKISGIGKAKQQKVDDALVEFHMARAKPTEEAPAAEPLPFAGGDVEHTVELNAIFGAAIDDDQWRLCDLVGVAKEFVPAPPFNKKPADMVCGIEKAVVDAKGVKTLGELADALADGDPLDQVFPDLYGDEAAFLVGAIADWFADDGSSARAAPITADHLVPPDHKRELAVGDAKFAVADAPAAALGYILSLVPAERCFAVELWAICRKPHTGTFDKSVDPDHVYRKLHVIRRQSIYEDLEQYARDANLDWWPLHDEPEPAATSLPSFEEAAPFNFVSTFPDPVDADAIAKLLARGGGEAWTMAENQRVHGEMIVDMVELQRSFNELGQKLTGAKGKAKKTIEAAIAEVRRQSPLIREEYVGLFGGAAWTQLAEHVNRLAAQVAANAAADEQLAVDQAPEEPSEPAVEQAGSVRQPPSADPGEHAAAAMEHPGDYGDVASPAELSETGLTIEQLERSRGAVRPSDSVGAKLQATWNSTVGEPVQLPDQPFEYAGYAAVNIRVSAGSAIYVLWPIACVDPARPAKSWGSVRSSARHAEDAPSAIPLDGIACTAADGTPYVFAHGYDLREVRVPHDEWAAFNAKRQAERDVAAHQLANRKAVPA